MAVDAKYGQVEVERGSIPADEPVFLIRAQDRSAYDAIMGYARAAAAHGCGNGHYAAVVERAQEIRDWQDANVDRLKVPD